MATSFNFELDNKPSRNGRYRVLLRITQNRKHKRIKTSISLNRKSDWNKIRKEVRQSEPNYKIWNDMLKKEMEKAKMQYLELKDYGIVTPDKLKDELIASERPVSFLKYAQQRTQELIECGNIRNAKKYKTFCNKLELFLTNGNGKVRDLSFGEITPSLVEDFYNFLMNLRNERNPDQVLHPNTVQTNLNIFRTLIKKAIEIDKLMKMDRNPFLAFKYKGVKTEKEKLNSEEIDLIIGLSLEENTPIWHCRNYFLFSYYCAGIRAGDFIQLRWCNISTDNRISYQMGKNHKTRDIKLPKQALDILELYRKDDSRPTDYIFPLLDNNAIYAKAVTQSEIDVLPSEIKNLLFNQISSKTAIINKYLKKIAVCAGINKNISFHIARHSFAKVAKEKGISTDVIQNILGHSKEETTKRYMGEIDNSECDKTMEKLFDN
ncbi:site-specific integrase [Bacteroides caecigallinarum]|uniref:site-specific integrase n=1 Tax=Bacteroides caecigallinarum TaxID=1411144 RepID=UPI001F45CA28|nr:site-specific integrase [Bacteroides caecigallinarum]MCF2738746.1 site-specific integrase [Bacteroides caecigallinarum]